MIHFGAICHVAIARHRKLTGRTCVASGICTEVCRIFFHVHASIGWRPKYYEALHIQIRHFQGVLLDELAAGLDLVAHQDSEQIVRGTGVFHLHLQQRAVGRV